MGYKCCTVFLWCLVFCHSFHLIKSMDRQIQPRHLGENIFLTNRPVSLSSVSTVTTGSHQCGVLYSFFSTYASCHPHKAHYLQAIYAHISWKTSPSAHASVFITQCIYNLCSTWNRCWLWDEGFKIGRQHTTWFFEKFSFIRLLFVWVLTKTGKKISTGSLQFHDACNCASFCYTCNCFGKIGIFSQLPE